MRSCAARRRQTAKFGDTASAAQKARARGHRGPRRRATCRALAAAKPHKTRRSAPRLAASVSRDSPPRRAAKSSQEAARETAPPARAANRPRSPTQVPRSYRGARTMVRDLLHPSASEEKRKHKLKRLVQSPNSFFMDVKCPGCFNITTVFSHAQTTVLCGSCSMMLCQPTGGKARLTEGCSFRKKLD